LKKLSIFVNPNIKPILKGSGRAYAIVLEDVPTGDVTVSFSSENSYVTFGSALIFTTGNYNVPQTITITAVTDGIVEGYKDETIICTPSGGGYSTALRFTIKVYDSGISGEYLRRKQWYGAHIRSASDIAAIRANMIDYLFNGNGLPSNAVPDVIVSSYTGTLGQLNTSNLTGVTRVDSLDFDFTDWQGGVWTSKVYHIITSATPKNILVMVHGGHGSEEYHKACIQDLLDEGYDVMYCFLPVTFQNTTTNPNITLDGVNGHNHILENGVETVSFSGMELFLYDKVMGLNYMDANYAYSAYYGTGCSGGGQMIKTLQAIDTRLTNVVAVRGYQANSGVFWEAGSDFSSDYEQGRSTATQLFYMEQTGYDQVFLATSGARKHYAVHHAFDTCCNKNFELNLVKAYFPAKIQAITGGDYELFLGVDMAYATHGWDVPDRAKMLEYFG
jgi:hypothetical protein